MGNSMTLLLRNAGAVVMGLTVGSVVNMGLIVLNTTVLYPKPPDVSFDDAEAFGRYVATLPLPAFLVVFAAHFGQAFVGGWIAAKLSVGGCPMLLSQIVGGLTLAGAIMNNMSLPVPKWTWIEMPFYPVVAWAAGQLVKNSLEKTTKKS